MEENEILKNDPASVKYRRNKNILNVLGSGVIMFGFWTIIKIIAQVLLGDQYIDRESIMELGIGGTIFVVFVVAFVFSIDFIMRLYVGLRARRESRGQKVGSGHLVVSVFLILGSLLSIGVVIWNIMDTQGDLDDNIAAIFLELSSLVITLEVFMASVSVKRYRKKLSKEGR